MPPTGYKYSDNEIKIAEWVGYKYQPSRHYSEDPYWRQPDGKAGKGCLPHYDTNDSDAIALLPLLQQRGYWWDMHLTDQTKQVQVNIMKYEKGHLGAAVAIAMKPTIAMAISEAVVALIESGATP